jgi:hypothetical protein
MLLYVILSIVMGWEIIRTSGLSHAVRRVSLTDGLAWDLFYQGIWVADIRKWKVFASFNS